MATATSRMVSRRRIIVVRTETVGIIVNNTVVAVEMSWMSRCPAWSNE